MNQKLIDSAIVLVSLNPPTILIPTIQIGIAPQTVDKKYLWKKKQIGKTNTSGDVLSVLANVGNLLWNNTSTTVIIGVCKLCSPQNKINGRSHWLQLNSWELGKRQIHCGIQNGKENTSTIKRHYDGVMMLLRVVLRRSIPYPQLQTSCIQLHTVWIRTWTLRLYLGCRRGRANIFE